MNWYHVKKYLDRFITFQHLRFNEKKIVILLCLLALSCQIQPDAIEVELYNCLINSLTEDEQEQLQPLITDFEQHLIEKGILASRKAKSYWNFYNRIAESGYTDFSNDFGFSEKISFFR